MEIWGHGCAQGVDTNPWVPAMVADVNGVAGDELRGGECIRVDSEFGAAVVSDQNRAWGCTHEREGELLVEIMERGRH